MFHMVWIYLYRREVIVVAVFTPETVLLFAWHCYQVRRQVTTHVLCFQANVTCGCSDKQSWNAAQQMSADKTPFRRSISPCLPCLTKSILFQNLENILKYIQ